MYVILCCIARSGYDFPALNQTALTLPSLPEYTSVMVPSFHCNLFCSLPFMTITSLALTFGSLLLCALNCVSHITM